MKMVYSEIGHKSKPHVMIHTASQIQLNLKHTKLSETVETQSIHWGASADQLVLADNVNRSW